MPTATRRTREKRRQAKTPRFVTEFLDEISDGREKIFTYSYLGGRPVSELLRMDAAPFRDWLESVAAINADARNGIPRPTVSRAFSPTKDALAIPKLPPFPHPAVDWICTNRLDDVRRCPACDEFFLATRDNKLLCSRTCKLRRYRKEHSEYKLRVKPKVPRRRK